MIIMNHSLNLEKRPVFKTVPLWLAGLGAKERSQHPGRGRYVQHFGNLRPISKDYRRNGFWEKQRDMQRKEAFKWMREFRANIQMWGLTESKIRACLHIQELWRTCGLERRHTEKEPSSVWTLGNPDADRTGRPPLSELWAIQMLIEQVEIMFPGTGEEKSVPGHQVIRG